MNYHREFEIAWEGLKNGSHEFSYEVNDRVFEELNYELLDFENLQASIALRFEKENNFFLLHFSIQGSVVVSCDRCGDLFSLQLWDEYNLVIKLTDSEEKAAEMNEIEEGDVAFIPRSETVINIFEWVYEFIVLSIPIQKVHPNLPDGSSGCNLEALKLLKKMSRPDEQQKAKNLWKGLEQFGNNFSEN